MWTVIKWTVWQRRWNTAWWCFGIVTLIVVTLIFYPTFRDQAAQLEKTFANLSGSALALFGGTDFFSPIGYLNSQLIYFTLPLILAILGIGLGTSVIGREEHDLTIEPLLARPISRTRLLIAKALAGTFILFTVTLVASLTTLVMAKAVSLDVPIGNIIIACALCFLLVLSFSAVAFLLAATGRGRGGALGIAVTYAMGGYVIGSLANTVQWLNTPSLVFPYHYYKTAEILHGSFVWSGVIFYVALIAGCGLLAWYSFRGRDIE